LWPACTDTDCIVDEITSADWPLSLVSIAFISLSYNEIIPLSNSIQIYIYNKNVFAYC
jgi:hypothetical protein